LEQPETPLPYALAIARSLSRLLAQAHSVGLHHLALRPSQVFLTLTPTLPTGAVGSGIGLYLVGLGLVQALSVSAIARLGLDAYALSFTAPERVSKPKLTDSDERPSDGPADVFSLGVLLWQTFSGVNPFVNSGPVGEGAPTLKAKDSTLPQLILKDPELPQQLPRLLVRMLSFAPAYRPTMAEVADFFERPNLSGPPLPSSSASAKEKASHPEQASGTDLPAISLPDGASLDPLLGALFGNFRTVRRIGAGGMGVVYEAQHRKIGRRAAVKIMHSELAQNPDFAARFLNEARAVNVIQHSGLVEIFEYGQLPDGTLFIVMEFLNGHSLRERIDTRKQPFPEEEAVRIGVQIARTLAAVHEKGIIHRDLKPENCMLIPDPITQQQDWVKILDFGIAKVHPGGQWDQARKRDHNRTVSGATLGTPRYMAPEQFGKAEKVDGKADVFSLGVLLYELLGGFPYAANSFSLLRQPLSPLRTRNPDVSERVAELIEQMLQLPPEKRPTMAAVVTGLSAPPAEVATSTRRKSDNFAKLSTGEVPKLAAAGPAEQESGRGRGWLLVSAGAGILVALLCARLLWRESALRGPRPGAASSSKENTATLAVQKQDVEKTAEAVVKPTPMALAPAALPGKEAQKLLQDGIEAYQTRRWERAAECFERLRALGDEGRVDAGLLLENAYHLGQVYEERKEKAKAMQEYSKLLDAPDGQKPPDLAQAAEEAVARLSPLVGHVILFRPAATGQCIRSDLYLPPGRHLVDLGDGKSQSVRLSAGATLNLNTCL
jgi:serine/threonine protein kinase